MSHIAERLVNTNYNYHGIHLNNIPMLLSKKKGKVSFSKFVFITYLW